MSTTTKTPTDAKAASGDDASEGGGRKKLIIILVLVAGVAATLDALVRDGKQFGQVALQQGVLNEDQLRDFLKIQVADVLFDAFVWTTGEFSFAEELDLPVGWEARGFSRVEDGEGERTYSVLHVANFALPAQVADYGGGAVERMGPSHVFIALLPAR